MITGGIKIVVEEISVKKVVDRKIAIALGIICIILAAGIVGAVILYFSQIDAIQSKDSEIASLTSQISSLTSQIADNSLQIETLTSQKNELQDIVSLAESAIWVDETLIHPAGYYSYWTFAADYAGYVKVRLETSNVTDNYVRVIYSSHGVDYDNQIDIVAGGVAVFPILPSTSIEIRFDTKSPVASTATLTITYYY
jgi:cell division protein FtsL